MRSPTLLAIALAALGLMNRFSEVEAAPQVGQVERPAVQRQPQKPRVVLPSIEVKPLPAPQRCGESQFVKVQVKNATSTTWAGEVQLLTQGIKIKVMVTLAPGETKLAEPTSPVKLDCTKPLPVQEVSAFPSAAPGNPVYKKTWKPQTLEGAIGFPSPPPNIPQVWLRRVMLELNCGQASKGIASIQNFYPTPQSVTVQLGFGGNPPQVFTIAVPPSNNASATLTIPALDCEQTISSLDYAFTTGTPRSGKLSVDTVTYAASN